MKRNKREATNLRELIMSGASNDEIKGALPNVNPQKIYYHRYYLKRRMKTSKTTIPSVNTLPKEQPAKVNDIQIGGRHYKQMSIQPWDAIQDWGLCYFSGNAVKYVARHRDKGGVEDLKKARHYLDKLIELMEGKND